MSIWNTGAAASTNVGFSMQNQLGTGITVNPIDPRIFGGSQGTRVSSGASKGSSGTSGKADKFDALAGAYSDIHRRSNLIDNAISNLPGKYMEKMMDESLSEDQMKSLSKEYVQAMNELLSEQSNMAIIKNQAEIEKKRWEAGNIELKGVEQEVAFNTDLVGSVQDGTDLLNTFTQERPGEYVNPVYIGNNKGRYNISSVEDWQSHYNNNSRIEENGFTTEYKMPARMSTSEEFNRNMVATLKDSGTEELYEGYSGDIKYMQERMSHNVLDALMSDDGRMVASLTTDEQTLYRTAQSIWTKMSERDKTYALSRTLRQGVQYNNTLLTGKQVLARYVNTDGTPMTEEQRLAHNEEYKDNEQAQLPQFTDEIMYTSGLNAVHSMDKFNRMAIEALESDDPAQRALGDQYRKFAKAYADGIVNTAKQNSIMTALGKQSDMATYTTSVQKKVDEYGGDKGPKNSTFLEAFIAKGQPTQQNMYRNRDDMSGGAMQKTPGTQAITINMSDTKEFLDRLFGVKNEKELSDANLGIESLKGQFYMNGVMFRAEAMYRDSKDPDHFKVLGIGNTAYNLPMYHMRPTGDIMLDPMTTEDGVAFNQIYIPVRIAVPFDAKIPVQIGNDKIEMIDIRKIADNKQAYPTIKVKELVNHTGRNTYEIEVLVPGADMYSTVDARDQSPVYHTATVTSMAKMVESIKGYRSSRERADKINQSVYSEKGISVDSNPITINSTEYKGTTREKYKALEDNGVLKKYDPRGGGIDYFKDIYEKNLNTINNMSIEPEDRAAFIEAAKKERDQKQTDHLLEKSRRSSGRKL